MGERICIRQVSRNAVDDVHTATRQGGMTRAFYVHLLGVDFSSRLFTVLIIPLSSLFGLRLRSRLQCMIIVIFLKHLKTGVQFHPIADLG